MSPRPLRCLALAFTLMVCAVLILTSGPARAQARSLSELKDLLRIDRTAITVSGISSGAYMAQQFQVVYSGRIRGAGLIAGGPYHCAGGFYFLSLLDPTGLYAALNVCSATNPLGLFTGPPQVQQSIDFTRAEAGAGRIDDPVQMRGARIWLLTGTRDKTVPTPVVESLASYYRAFVPPGQVRLVTLAGAGHAMITDDFGNACDAQEPPFINDCDFDAAAALLQYLHGPTPLAPRVREAARGSLIEFDQTPFFDPNDHSVSLHPLGHVYVPALCARGVRCRLHVAFHGCRQSQDDIGDAFYTHAGYNEVAESNAMVVLYPQVKAWSESLMFQYTENPRGCWDWWGYSGENFMNRSGKQIQAVAKMINTLVGEQLFPR